MLREVVDPFGEDCHLDLGRAGVGLVEAVLLDRGGLVGHASRGLSLRRVVPKNGSTGGSRRWQGGYQRSATSARWPAVPSARCPVGRGGRRRLEWLDGQQGSHTTSLCGRNAVQVAHRSPSKLNFEEMARHLELMGSVTYNRFLLKFEAEGHEFTVFPDGRAIIKGTNDVDRARTLYAKYVGH